MRQGTTSSECSFLRNAYLLAFIPAVVLLSGVVFVICLVKLLIGRAKAGIA